MPVLLIRDRKKQRGLEAAGGCEDLCSMGTLLSNSFSSATCLPSARRLPTRSTSSPSLHRLLPPHSSPSSLVTYSSSCRQKSHCSLGKWSQGKENISSSNTRRFYCGVFPSSVPFPFSSLGQSLTWGCKGRLTSSPLKAHGYWIQRSATLS